MKMSPETLKVLKNFLSINSSIVISPGSELVTISNSSVILGRADVAETFPAKLNIYDIQSFLGTLDLFESPVLDFEESTEYVVIHEENCRDQASSRFWYCAEGMIKSPAKVPVMPSAEVVIKMPSKDLVSLVKAGTVLGVPDMVITPSGNPDKPIAVETVNSAIASSNKFSLAFEGDIADGADFRFIIKLEHLNILVGNYDVGLSSHKIAHFAGEGIDYWCAMDKDSTYTGA